MIIRESGAELGYFRAGEMLAREQPIQLNAFVPVVYPNRLNANQSALFTNYSRLMDATRDGELITPAGEWLLDNHHVVEENFRHLKRDLAPRYYRKLPQVTLAGSSDQIPAVLAVAWRYVSLSNSDFHQETLTEMGKGFQEVRVFTIGELWAIPAMLRFVLLENLRRLSDRVSRARAARVAANLLADKLIREELVDWQPGEHETISAPFAAQLLYRLRDGSQAADKGLARLEAALEGQGKDSALLLSSEHALQSAGNVTVGNIIRSMRRIDETNWTEWFEELSRVDAVLRQASDFPHLDRPTRNDYRDAIERISRRSSKSEIEVANLAVRMAGSEATGHLLVGGRVAEFETACNYRPTRRERVLAAWRRSGWMGIISPGLVLTFAAAFAITCLLPASVPAGFAALMYVLTLLTVSEASTGVVNLVSARFVPARKLPAYDYETGIPEEARTLVAVPCLIADLDTVDDFVSLLELHYLANPDGAVDFALITDWPDSSVEESDNDRRILAYAQAEIDAMAAKYAHVGRRFYLLHRNRLWNPIDKIWMGWERKRGKLMELNTLLLGSGETTFTDCGARPPTNIRFVITLDSDTRLPRGTVAALVGKMMHPVNRPVSDPKSGVVISGHAVMQPRVTPSLTTGAEASVFQHVFSAGRGMDPYVFTVSDMYQDLMDEGSFTGKGIYDLAAFEGALAGRIPENSVLSHDLIEGNWARAALVSDVQVVEDYPIRYDVDASRQHRWIRGDWQLLPFIFNRANGLRPLGRLKMVDNLRRSLVMPAWLISSVLGFFLLPPEILWWWQLSLLVTLFFMPIMNFQSNLMPTQPGVAAIGHMARIGRDLAGHFSEILLRVVFMAHQASIAVDAISRTLWRLLVSRRRLLQWRTAQQVQASGVSGWRSWWSTMIASPILGLVILGITIWVNPAALPVAALFCGLWIIAPEVARAVSQSMETEDRLDVSPADEAELRRVARTTWRFFETFVTAQTHYLPPDNFQDTPAPKLAERTSPTNIGLYLLSILSARDMGWIGHGHALTMIERTVDTLERMERYKGHLYNWYDTRDLQVMQPHYISTVDSGNLAGHMLALASALRDWAKSPGSHVQSSLKGIGDTLAVLVERLSQVPDDRRTLRPLRRRLEELIEGFARSHTAYMAEPQLATLRALNLTLIAADICQLAADLHAESDRSETEEVLWWAQALRANCDEIVGAASETRASHSDLATSSGQLAERVRKFAFEMDFGLLMNRDKHLLSIGYRTDTEELDDSCYDLLASEARLASLFAIAKGDVPTEHWMRLGRPVVALGTRGVLLSWSGSMFEYLMPLLVMHERTGGLLNSSNAMAVNEHIRHGRRLGLPWGVSESAFAARDREMNYQYYAFGVPHLALKRMQQSNHVVAPYATLMAAQIRPHAAVQNLRRLDALGAFGTYGYFDAIDFTSARLPEGHDHLVVRTVMAHHHGMSLVAITDAVMDGIHRERFHSDPVIKAAELLLQEKAPREIVPVERAAQFEPRPQTVDSLDPALSISGAPASDRPIVALLSNGRFSTMISATGTGPTRFEDLDVTRWRRDPTVDTGGIYLFLRDLASNDWWSATTSPRQAPGEKASAVISDYKAEFHKTAFGIESKMEVIVASEAAGEGRKLTLRNTGSTIRTIEVTSYCEIVLDRADADLAHPAFSKMFVKTAIRDDGRTITAFRNPRAPKDRVLHMAHLLAGATDQRPAEAETDRRAFIGRGRDLGTAAAFERDAQLSGADGFTLDPICAIRRRIRIPAGKSVSLQFWTLVAESAEDLEQAILHHRQDEVFTHEERMSWSMSQVQLRHAAISLEEAALFRCLGAALIWPDPRLALQDEEVRNDVGPQNALWSMGISGDRPIFLLRIDDEADLEIVRKALRMADYFRMHGLAADLVILNERQSSYTQELQFVIDSMCDMSARASHLDKAHRSVFPLRRDLISDAGFRHLLAAAQIVMHTRNGKLSEQVARLVPVARPAPQIVARQGRPRLRVASAFPDEPLRFWNGYGGFSEDGQEYVVRMRHGERTPQPWINVIARDDFGFHVSAGGAAFTWSVNSRDYQITPWSNDPVTNRPGEAILIHDPATGAVISPFAALSDDPHAIHEARHGLGQSTFRVWTDWVEVEAVMTLAKGTSARLTGLTIRNTSDAKQRLQVLSYAELVLGNNRGRTAPMIRAGMDADLGALVARNSFSTDVPGRVTALAASHPFAATTVSRRGFLGRNGVLGRPLALSHWPEELDAEGDPCLAARFDVTIPPKGERQLTLILADAEESQIAEVLNRASSAGALEEGLTAAREEWGGFCGQLQVDTPDEKLNLMVNTWLPYQSLTCRIRARSAFYQASGAYGFRDQLQDTSSLILQDASLARAQILNAAGRQFREGDVQHWWLPRTGAGVRTMISDDVVWLGNITARYVAMTADTGILDEPLPFLNGPELEPGQHDNFFVPETAPESATLYEHCTLALDLAIKRTGPQGLPLMLGGDWNDGMNRVGEGGQGESVWLGWFLLATLDAFLPLAEARGDSGHVSRWSAHRASLLEALETAGWDGAWYRRAYYDDGTPLGAQGLDECRIDSIAQSWAAMSGAGDPARAKQGLDAVLENLADKEAGVLRLFTPPFEHTNQEPGYIKGYPPGVRENGGQYTHAATWVVNALGRAGRGSEALAMFDLINPISHAETQPDADRYRVEPYVVAADVYGEGPRLGRGGWTWYTGSAGWLYRAAVEGILGITLVGGDRLSVDPALPDEWDGFSARLMVRGQTCEIRVSRGPTGVSVTLNGDTAPNNCFDISFAMQRAQIAKAGE